MNPEGKKSPSKTLTNSEPRLDAQDNKRARAHSDHSRQRIEECLRTTPHGAERLDRRNEVTNEALAEEVQRGEQRKKRSDKATAAVPESEPAASAAPEPREAAVEPDPNPKRRLLMMKSASSTASGSGQQKEKKSIPDDESRTQVEDTSEMGTGESTELPGAPSANTRRRIVVKSEPVAVTTQETVAGYCKKAMRIGSVEQIELGKSRVKCSNGQDSRTSLEDCHYAKRMDVTGKITAT